MNIVDFQKDISTRGYSLFPGIVPPDMLEKIRSEIPICQQVCREWQKKNGLETGMQGSAHHIVGGGQGLNNFLYALYLDNYIEAYFGGSKYILNSFGAVNNSTYTEDSYKHGLQFHRDVRTFSGDFRLMLNMLVMIDEFTVENGATRLVPGTHRFADRPEVSYLEDHAIRATGTAGSILLFDSNLWHAASPNTTTGPRMALTLTFTRPFVKQQMDYPRMLGETFPLNERVRQVLGYNARVPASYDEWYQPPEKRMYKLGQG